MSTKSAALSDLNQSQCFPEEAWEMALGQLQMQMTQATFDSWVKGTHVLEAENGTWQVGVKNDFARDWLQNRLYTTIRRTVAGIVGHPVEITFVVDIDALTTPELANVQVKDDPTLFTDDETMETRTELSADQMIAQADYYKGFFEKGGAGFSQLTHHIAYFWMPLLGPAFFLWKWLDSQDPRSLKSIKPNYWSLPRKYSYTELAAKLNRRHGRYIAGDTLECERSRLARQANQPIQGKNDCCGSPSYECLWLKSHPKGQGLMCQHWKNGLLDILRQEGLAAVELNSGERKPTVQIWRMPPIITPRQYTRLNEHIQSDYDDWLDKFGHLFGISDRKTWQSIEKPTLAPLMPGYDQVQVIDNFDQRRKKQEFLEKAFPNPQFVSSAGRSVTE